MLILIISLFLVVLVFKPTRRTLLALVSLILLKIFGISVGVNLLNAALIGLLGFPGIISVAVLNIIY